MEQHNIYWASVGLHSEFAHVCLEAAQSLSNRGVSIDHRQADRIMVAYDLHADSGVQESPADHFDKSCQSLSA